jgi:hypothetical protein
VTTGTHDDASPAPASERAEATPRFVYPEPLSAADVEDMEHDLDVDGAAYIRWLMGEGPDPCPESSG